MSERYQGFAKEIKFNEKENNIDFYVELPSVNFNVNSGNDIVQRSSLGRDIVRSFRGKVNTNGTSEVPADLKTLEFFFDLALAGVRDTGSRKYYWGNSRRLLDSFRTAIGKDVVEEIYRGNVVSEISFSANGDLVYLTINSVGASVDSGEKLKEDSEVYDKLVEKLPIIYEDLKLLISDNGIDYKELDPIDWTFSLNNNANVDNAHVQSSRFPGPIKGGNREVNLNINLGVHYLEEFLIKYYGNSKGPDEGIEKPRFSLKIEGIKEGEQFEIELPNCKVDTLVADYSGNDDMNPSVGIVAEQGKKLVGGIEERSSIFVSFYKNDEE